MAAPAKGGAAVGAALPPGVAQAVPQATLSVPVFDKHSFRQPRQPTYDSWSMAWGLEHMDDDKVAAAWLL